jgi:beta propeller repeat protein
MKRQHISLVLTVLMLINGVLSCSQPTTTPGQNLGNESWLIGEKLYYGPQAISGDNLVFHESIPGDSRVAEQYITLYNLRTYQRERLVSLDADLFINTPTIDGTHVVWSSVNRSDVDIYYGPESGNMDVFCFDLTTRTTQQITPEEHAQIQPRISGNIIVWLDTRNMATNKWPYYYDVYAYDLGTNQERRLTTTTSIREDFLSISGNIVAWSDDRYAISIPGKDPIYTDQNNEIFIYDLSTEQERRITENPGSDLYPVIGGNHIAWLRKPDSRKVNGDIFLYDLENGMERRISSSTYASQQSWPSISENRIVWADARKSQGNDAGDVGGVGEDGISYSGTAEIYLFDLQNETETLLVPSEESRFTMTSGDKDRIWVQYDVWMRPVIYGDYLVYEKETGIQPYLYALNLNGQ